MASSSKDFVVLRPIGSGQYGSVHLARRRADQRLYALKDIELPHGAREAAAVMQETHILASLEHPFIVRYYDSFVELRRLVLVMEYAENGSLHTVLQRHQKLGRPLGEGVLWRYAIQLLVGLHAIHRRRVVHRDIKPHNIFLGAGDTVKIGDFGVSKLLSSTMPLANTFVGSPGYLAPELCNGEPYDEKADIWAFGVTLIELCLLQHPFAGSKSQAALVMKIMRAAPPPIPHHYSKPLGRLLQSCMQRHAAHRPSAHQLLSIPLLRQRAAESPPGGGLNLLDLLPPLHAAHRPDPPPPQAPPTPTPPTPVAAPPPPALEVLAGGESARARAAAAAAAAPGRGRVSPPVGSGASSFALSVDQLRVDHRMGSDRVSPPLSSGSGGNRSEFSGGHTSPALGAKDAPWNYGGGRDRISPPLGGGGDATARSEAPTARARVAAPGGGVPRRRSNERSSCGAISEGAAAPPSSPRLGGEGPGGGSGGSSGSATTPGGGWAIRPVRADKRASSWHRQSWKSLHNIPTSTASSAAGSDADEPPPRTLAAAQKPRSPRSPSAGGRNRRRSGDGDGGRRRASGEGRPQASTSPNLGEGAAALVASLAEEALSKDARPPATPPTLWAKRTQSDAGPSSVLNVAGGAAAGVGARPPKLQMMNGGGWEELKSPLDVFANKHCPRVGASIGALNISAAPYDDGPLHAADVLRGNASPLADLLRREFPRATGPPAAAPESLEVGAGSPRIARSRLPRGEDAADAGGGGPVGLAGRWQRRLSGVFAGL